MTDAINQDVIFDSPIASYCSLSAVCNCQDSPIANHLICDHYRYSCYNDSGMSSMGWQSQPQPPGGQCPSHQQNGPTQQQLSVVTTVWGVKTNQSGPPMSQNYCTTNGPANGPPSAPGVQYGGQTGHDGYTTCPTTPMPPQKSYQTQAMNQRAHTGPGYAGLVVVSSRATYLLCSAGDNTRNAIRKGVCLRFTSQLFYQKLYKCLN